MRWLNDEQHGNIEDASKHLINFDCGLLKRGSNVRVRLVHSQGEKDYVKEYLVFQKLDLQSSYERLQHAMTHYYTKISNASRSLEKNSTDNTVASTTSSSSGSSSNSRSVSLSDSMESTADSSDPFTQEFKAGQWCAAKMSVSRTWSRCIILEISNKRAFIECIDDDQQQYMPLCKLEKLSNNFMLMHRYAFKAKLNDSLVSLKLLNSNSIDSLKTFILNKQKSNGNELMAKIIEVTNVSHGDSENLNENVYEISLSLANNKSIFEQLC